MNPNTLRIFENIQQQFGRQFHSLQTLCLQFLLNYFEKSNFFINFGLGNGKTLICTALAILVNKIAQIPVIILVKSQYLAYRDHTRFKNLIHNSNVICQQQFFVPEGITFMDEKSFHKDLTKTLQSIKIKQSDIFVILDEYDSLFDDTKPQLISEKIKKFQYFRGIIGSSGSKTCLEEQQCLYEILDAKFITFPNMKEIYGDNLLQRRSQIFTNDNQWLQNLKETCESTCNQVPVLLALDSGDIKKVKNYFKVNKMQIFDLVEQQKKEILPNFRPQLTTNLTNLGRGTDFPTNNEIEDNGGIYLIIGDVFQERTLDQIKGRICWMQSKGQYQYIVSMKQDGNVYEYIKLRQNILNLKNQTNSEKLLSIIRTSRFRELNESQKFSFLKNEIKVSPIQQEQQIDNQQNQVEFLQSQFIQQNIENENDNELIQKVLKYKQENIIVPKNHKNTKQQINKSENLLQKRKSQLNINNLEKMLNIKDQESENQNLQNISKKLIIVTDSQKSQKDEDGNNINQNN